MHDGSRTVEGTSGTEGTGARWFKSDGARGRIGAGTGAEGAGAWCFQSCGTGTGGTDASGKADGARGWIGAWAGTQGSGAPVTFAS